MLGFFDVSEIGGPAYADSVNVGMTDLVASLKWVRENIANFGGDPDAVMIYGQSGGGSKVTCLMGMPGARGCSTALRCSRAAAAIFPAASIEGTLPADDEGTRLAAQRYDLAAEDGLGQTERGRQCRGPKVNPAPQGAGGPGGPPSATPRAGFAPTVDGRIVTLRSFYDAAPDVSKNVPMLIGNVSEEGNRMSSRPTEAEWHQTLTRTWGADKAAALIAAMKKEYPQKSIRLLSYGVNGVNSRNNVQRMVKLKFEQKGAPVYQYYFTWQSPMLEDAGAWHTSELAFCFDNTEAVRTGHG